MSRIRCRRPWKRLHVQTATVVAASRSVMSLRQSPVSLTGLPVGSRLCDVCRGKSTLVERFDIEPYSDFSVKLSNFIGLVLSCIDAKFCKKIFDEKLLTRSTRFTYCCSAQTSKFQQTSTHLCCYFKDGKNIFQKIVSLVRSILMNLYRKFATIFRK